MSRPTELDWRDVPRAIAPYAERADDRERPIDRWLLAVAAGFRQRVRPRPGRAQTIVKLVEAEQEKIDRLGDESLRQSVDELRAALVRNGLAPELIARAFALVRTAARRSVGMAHFPVQILGGYAMLQGMLAEMQTGEGKTLTATLPAATMALLGVPVHVITVNDYLAKRDAEWMGPVYAALGLGVGIVQHGQDPHERRAAYAADITYCTNKELGFDYLRDRLALPMRQTRTRSLIDALATARDRSDELLLRGLHFAIVDEADSVLIDEARTPLIISGQESADASDQLYAAALVIARSMTAGADYRVDPRARTVLVTERGKATLASLAERLPGAWASSRGREEIVQQALSAIAMFHKDTHYIVRDGKVQIVDEYTGRVLEDRSWERGLQQLIEAKEGCQPSGRRSTLARITFQRLFRRYLRLSGMTGTALEVGPELDAVYGLKVVAIPTNRPARRLNTGVRTFRTGAEKWNAITEAIADCQRQGRPVLVGTRSVGASEHLSAKLAALGIDHQVLNARQDQHEAQIIERAGEAGRITVATNMAGRGTDIRLAPGIEEKGGLHVILTEFHEAARVDRQLFGRCARQGDRGSCEAIVSLEDEIFVKHAHYLTAALGSADANEPKPVRPMPAEFLRRFAQGNAERVHARVRRATLQSDRNLESALAFAGQAE